MVLIADADGPTSIAGVMGGARSEVSDGTTRVLMEAANWYGANIHRTSLSARAALGGVDPVREAAAARAGARRARAGDAADDRCLRRARWRPARSTSAARGRSRRRSACAARKITSLLGVEVPVERCARDPDRARVRRRRRARRARRDRARVPAHRRDPRGRPDRGGVTARGARDAAGDAALAPRRLRAADRPPAAAAGRQRRAHRAGPARDRRLELRGARPRPAAADRRAAGGRAAEPDVGRAVAAAHDPARIAARRRAVQPLARRPGDPVVRGRRRVPGARRRRRPSAGRALPRRRAADRSGAARHLA